MRNVPGGQFFWYTVGAIYAFGFLYTVAHCWRHGLPLRPYLGALWIMGGSAVTNFFLSGR